MFDGVFDVLVVSEAKTKRRGVAGAFNRVADRIDDDGRTEGVAFLLADGVPTMSVYEHWRTVGGGLSEGEHGRRATFIDLSRVTAVGRDGEGVTVLRGVPPFASVVDSSHVGRKVTDDDADPMAEHGVAETVPDNEVRIDDVYDPSVLDVVSEWLGDGKDAEQGGDRGDGAGRQAGERDDGSEDDAGTADTPPVTYERLENSYDLRESVKAWHLSHPGEAVRTLRCKAESVRRLSHGCIVGAILCVFLFLYGVRVAGETGSSLVMVVALMAMTTCGVAPMFLSVRGLGHALGAERHLRERARVAEPGEATVIREGDKAYLLVRENPVRVLDGRDMTDYVLVRLGDGMPRASYDEATRIVAFSGDGLWRVGCVRYDADTEVIPSRDIPHMGAIPAYEVADTFVPSLREVVGLVATDGAEGGDVPLT